MTRFAERRRIKPDVFMIAYDESNMEEHWTRLQAMQPAARLIRGVKGIYAAYRVCARAAKSPLFFAVDADNFVHDGFEFTVPLQPAPNEILVWRARNPLNGLTYGHGGIKLFPTALFRQPSPETGIDISTSIATRTRTIGFVASEHRFNTSPYKTWSTAFRECAKLAQESALGRFKEDAAHVLDVRCTAADEAAFGSWCVKGSLAGRSYGLEFATDDVALARINDYAWMQRYFAQSAGTADVPAL